MNGLEPLYKTNVRCIHCSQPFQSSRVRPSFKKGNHTDSDFCVHFKEFNPEYYVVKVCPFCGFACTDNFSDKMTPAQKAIFHEKVASNWSMKDYSGERTWGEALSAYKLALLCAQIKQETDRVLSGLLHHIAWMYRYVEDENQERRFLQFALESYISVYEHEGKDYNNAKLMYLLGELNRRLGNYNEAVKWFSRIIHDPKIMDAAMIHASREQWEATREDMLNAKLELPQEMINNK
jgi:uncharacterized protein (DUF2225 family)